MLRKALTAELRLVQARHDIILKEFKLIAATGGLTANKLGLGMFWITYQIAQGQKTSQKFP